MSLRVVDVPAQRGIAWVRDSLALFFRAPLGFSMMFLLFLVAALVLMALPLAGALLLLALIPLLTLGFAAGTRAARRGEPVHAGLLLEPLRRSGDAQRRRVLLRLCLLYAALTAATMLLAHAVDGGAFERLQLAMAKPRNEASGREIDALLADPQLAWGMALRLGLLGALSVPFWHAPMLVWWQGQGLAQSLFSSTLACWRNRGAFLLYLAGWVAIAGAVGIAAAAITLLLGAPALASLTLPPLALLISVAFYVSLYLVYADSFASD
jgi:hypothetical protein